ncbi:MAG TPA: sulfotransferase [Gemmatimonadales bacterium]|nr:sulfotransferase [Gemmatimonadales bacterium]
MTTVSVPATSRPVSPRRTRPRTAPFFIFGCPRSGTSLLSAMLGSHPNLAIPDESHLYSHIYPVVRRHGTVNHSARQSRLVAEILRTEHIKMWRPAPSLGDTLRAITDPGFHGIVSGLMGAWAASQGKPRWGEKTPQHTLRWRTIMEGFPNAQIIHLIRDGRDVMLSYKSAFFGPKHVYPLAIRWRQYLAAAADARAFVGDNAFLQVRYEDLLAAPQKELRRICAFLGEKYAPAMLEYYRACRTSRRDSRDASNLRSPLMTNNAGKWRTQMTNRELRIFEALAGPCLERHAYQRALAEPRISRWEALACRYLEHPPRRLRALFKNQEARRLALQGLRLHLCLMR